MNRPRILLAHVGDIQREDHARIKFGLFADSLAHECGPLSFCDATLRGWRRFFNALQVFSPRFQVWRERFWKNTAAFDTRSRLVARQVQREKPDLVVQIGVIFDATRYQREVPVYLYCDYTAALSAARPGTLRSPFTAADLKRWLAMETETYQCASHIFVRSHMVKESLERDYGIEAAKISIVGGGVNLSPLPQLQDDTGGSAPTVLFIGKEFSRKGGDLLLQAFALVNQELPAARLRVVTGEPIPSGLPLDGVHVYPATWQREPIFAHYLLADLFVLPSRLETWGDVLLEAMAFGLPCIGVESDAMGEIIVHGETGLLTPAGDVPALASGLLMILRDPHLRARMGAAGRNRVETRFTWDKVAAQMGAIIQERINL